MRGKYLFIGALVLVLACFATLNFSAPAAEAAEKVYKWKM